MLVDWNNVRKKIMLSSGLELDLYGDLFALKRFDLETCEEYRIRVLYVFDKNMNYLINGLDSYKPDISIQHENEFYRLNNLG